MLQNLWPWRRREPLAEPRRSDVFVLSGGSVRGAVQVGMLRALLEHGISPAAVVGCSAGAMNGAYFASDPTFETVDELERIWTGEVVRRLFHLGPRDLLAGLVGRPWVFSPAPLEQLASLLPYQRLEQAKVPVRVVTTRLDDGSLAVHASGPAIPPIVASCSIPGLFPPVRIDDRMHIDGGVAAIAPVEVAEEFAPARIFLLDATGPVMTPTRSRNAVEAALTGLSHSVRAQARIAQRHHDVVSLSVPDEKYRLLDMFSPKRSEQLIQMGYEAATAQLDLVDRLS